MLYQLCTKYMRRKQYMSIFKGSGVALVTPMKENGEINYDSLERLIEDQIKTGTSGGYPLFRGGDKGKSSCGRRNRLQQYSSCSHDV